MTSTPAYPVTIPSGMQLALRRPVEQLDVSFFVRDDMRAGIQLRISTIPYS